MDDASPSADEHAFTEEEFDLEDFVNQHAGHLGDDQHGNMDDPLFDNSPDTVMQASYAIGRFMHEEKLRLHSGDRLLQLLHRLLPAGNKAPTYAKLLRKHNPVSRLHCEMRVGAVQEHVQPVKELDRNTSR